MTVSPDNGSPGGETGAGRAEALPPIRRFGALFGAVVAPTSFVTGLLYYFGLNQAYWFYAYFGVDATLLGLGTTDYLVISVDSLFVPMVVAAGAGLAAFWGHDLLRARLTTGARPRVLRILVPVLGSAGFLLALGGFWSVLDDRLFLRSHLAMAPLSLAIGVILLAYTLQLRRSLPPERIATPSGSAPDEGAEPPTSPEPPDASSTSPRPRQTRQAVRSEWVGVAEWAVSFVLVGLSLIWAASDYAAAVGRGRAQGLVSQLSTSTTTVLRSERSLGVDVPGVREVLCDNAKSAYPYRYEGLVLVIQSADQYVLLPQSWTRDTGVALVIPRTDAVRLEFVPYAARGTLNRSVC
ncbi:hypothetical protein ACIGMX_07600 [Streptomyces aquilus]|uniref:hypothetical protein n=1 Tax=Streptomyces aquilus TaxID=2548456 RepID=UPI0037D69764